MTTYTLLSKQTVDLTELEPRERAFLRDLDKMKNAGVSYFEVYRTAIGPGSLALQGRNRVTRRILASPLYLVARDIATRAGVEQGLVLAPEHERQRASAPADTSMISVTQAAELIGVSRAMVYKAIDAGNLRAQKIGNVTIVKKASAIDYRDRRGRRLPVASSPESGRKSGGEQPRDGLEDHAHALAVE